MKEIIIKNKLDQFLLPGILQFENIQHNVKENLKRFISEEIIEIRNDFIKELPPGYSDSRKLYRSFKIDPTKHRPSSEALWRRLKRELPFPEVNYFVDLINYLSLKHQISYGLYDKDKISGNVTIDLGKAEDTYEGIRKDLINLNKKITIKDDLGPFGNPSSDSLRTSTDINTKNLMIIIFFYKESSQINNVVKDSYDHFKKFFTFSAYTLYPEF